MKLTALVLAGLLPIAAGLMPMAAALSALAAPTQQAPKQQTPQQQDPTQQTQRGQAQEQEPASKVQESKTSGRRATVIFLRHAEALPRTDGNQNPNLSDLGKARAQLEAKTLAAAGVTRIFATELQRTQQTATPLAELLGLKVEQYRARSSKAFTDTLRGLKDGEVAVVIGHSNTVPVMVKALGGTLKDLDKKGYLPDTQHDRMIVQVLSSAKSDEAMNALQTLDLRIN
tara:strand:- start:2197 stop:2883 length:687 start_codon:yes stop_codon:yes gene_type:complete